MHIKHFANQKIIELAQKQQYSIVLAFEMHVFLSCHHLLLSMLEGQNGCVLIKTFVHTTTRRQGHLD